MIIKKITCRVTECPGGGTPVRPLLTGVAAAAVTLSWAASANPSISAPVSCTQVAYVCPVRSVNHPTCQTATRDPETVIRAWLRTHTYARGSAISCNLSAASYHPGEPPFGRYYVALVQPLRPQSQPGHRLYVILLINSTRAARYLLDLQPDTSGRWLVDLWAEL
jgi:hypothetical protein